MFKALPKAYDSPGGMSTGAIEPNGLDKERMIVMAPYIALFVGVGSVVGWICGEMLDRPKLRYICVPLSIVVWSAVAAAVVAIDAAMSRGIPFSETVHAFVKEIDQQLEAGRVEHVRKQLGDFKENAPVTYEFGAFLDNVRKATERMGEN